MKTVLSCLLFVLLPVTLGRTADSIAAWDHSEKDILGNSETLASAQYAITSMGVDLNQMPEPWPLLAEKEVQLRTGTPPQPVDWKQLLRDAGVPEERIQEVENACTETYCRADKIDDLLSDPDLAAGGSYLLWARVSDPAGNWSEWAKAEEPIVLPDTIRPAPPKVLNCFGCPK